MEEKKPLIYEDKETKTKLYGFSNHDIKKIYIAMWVMIVIFIIVIAMAGYVLWKVEAYNIVGKYIARCVC